MENKFPQRGAIYLACSERHQHWDTQTTQNGFPACAAPKLSRYLSERIHPTFTCGQIVSRKGELWRWAELDSQKRYSSLTLYECSSHWACSSYTCFSRLSYIIMQVD